MADSGIDSQNMIVKVDGELISCVLEMGDYSETRGSNSYTCMSSDEEFISFGSITRGSFDISVPYNPDNTAGIAKLNDSFDSKVKYSYSVELDDKVTPVTGTGTISTITMGVLGRTKIYEKDGIVQQTFTVQPTTGETITPAT